MSDSAPVSRLVPGFEQVLKLLGVVGFEQQKRFPDFAGTLTQLPFDFFVERTVASSEFHGEQTTFRRVDFGGKG